MSDYTTLVTGLLDANPDLTPSQIADLLFIEMRRLKLGFDFVRPAVEADLWTKMRARTRGVERRVAGLPTLAGMTVATAEVALLLNRGFPLSDGRFVLWGDATEDDHRLRCDDLRRKSDGIHKTIALHEDVIATIRKAGAKTWREALDKRGKK